jgi:hypothetical protein
MWAHGAEPQRVAKEDRFHVGPRLRPAASTSGYRGSTRPTLIAMGFLSFMMSDYKPDGGAGPWGALCRVAPMRLQGLSGDNACVGLVVGPSPPVGNAPDPRRTSS